MDAKEKILELLGAANERELKFIRIVLETMIRQRDGD